jgi:FKBP-type peptidyl-prolyl cis-trans isomerase FkpA
MSFGGLSRSLRDARAMPLALLALALGGCGGAVTPAATAAPAAVQDMTDDQRALYALGIQVAASLRSYDLAEDEFETMLRGMRASRNGKPELKIRLELGNLQRFQGERQKRTVEREKEASAQFIEQSAAESGAERTSSGLVYRAVQEGSGASPTVESRVKVHYHGTLRDGTVFDSSVERGEPATFPLNGVIPCWTEGVQKMKVGGKARLVCPADIAYGERGVPPFILPGAALNFEVELLEILN